MNTAFMSTASVHSWLRHSVLLFVSFLIGCLAISPNMQAVTPPPDGGYPNGNTALGQNALFSLTSGTYNTAIGLLSLRDNTTGGFNTGVGAGTLLTNTGSENTATGAGALLSNTTGSNNTANGESALFYNTTGGGNTANGANALSNNTTGSENTATGRAALQFNTGARNTAVGARALLNNTTGANNTANGEFALPNNTTGSFNTATGGHALEDNTTGNTNVAIGYHALEHNTTGAENTAVGVEAGRDQTNGSGNVYIGRSMVGVAGESNKTYIRNINSTGLNGAAVTVNVNTGLLGHATSSCRYKEEIRQMDQASEALYQLRPVTFRYKQEIDRTHALSFGLIAEEVAEVNPDLIVRDSAGKPETVRYEAVNAMLLNEFLKEHRKGQEQEAAITQLKSAIAKQEATIAQQRRDFEATLSELRKEIETVSARFKEQDAKIQRVSDQIELSKPAAQLVNNDQ
jgi:hypothetical protein